MFICFVFLKSGFLLDEMCVNTRLAVGMDKPWTGDGFGDIMQKKLIRGL